MEAINFNGKRLRLAQDLPKRCLGEIALSLVKKANNGIYKEPSEEEVCAHIEDLAEQGIIKHYSLKGEHCDVKLYDSDEALREFQILVRRAYTGIEIIRVQCNDEKATHEDDVPLAISGIENLYKLPSDTFNPKSCVYFLCHKGEVVYVGQSVDLHSRIMAHQNDKLFDNVYYMRIHKDLMFEVEGALIAYLKPKYNLTSLKISDEKESLAKNVLSKPRLEHSEIA